MRRLGKSKKSKKAHKVAEVSEEEGEAVESVQPEQKVRYLDSVGIHISTTVCTERGHSEQKVGRLDNCKLNIPSRLSPD